MASILIVEDDAAIRQLIVEVLRDEGYDVLEAADGQAGVEMAQAQRPALILMDIMLPKLDGATAIRMLRDNPATQTIRIIAMSAGSTLLKHVGQLQADSVLGKPFDLDVLLADVALHLRRAAEEVLSPESCGPRAAG